MRSTIPMFLFVLAAVAAAGQDWPVVLPIAIEKNLPLVQIRVNGSEPLTFILDSAAAACVIDPARAASIGLKVGGGAMSSGSGGQQAVQLIDDVRLNLGGIEIVPPRTFAFDMKALAFKSRVDGILGMPLFGKYVVEIDYPNLRVHIFQPGSYRPSPKAQVLPLRMTVGPVVRGSIKVRGKDPIEADMQLDTGSAHVLTICTPFVDRHNLVASADEVVAGTTRGFGGQAADFSGRIEEVRLGRSVMQNPVVRFSRQTTGSFGSEKNFSANLGGEFLKAYKVAFDIPGLRLVLE